MRYLGLRCHPIQCWGAMQPAAAQADILAVAWRSAGLRGFCRPGKAERASKEHALHPEELG